jgi:uncharacterized protein YkwD
VTPTIPYDSGDPTNEEQLVLEMINRARSDPVAEGRRLGIDIKEGLTAEQQTLVGPRPPLAMSKILLGTARSHSRDMHDRNFFSHTNPDGQTFADRITNAGYHWMMGGTIGENIAASSSATAAQLEDALMIDTGVAGRGHRVNLLDIRRDRVFREVGPGFFSGTAPNPSGFKDFITQDLGAVDGTAPFALGVVYRDSNGNKFYDPGEGLAGVTVRPDQGTFFAVTSNSGGYAFPTGSSGSITVTASGGGLPSPVSRMTALAGNNVKVDFVLGR